MTGSPEAAELQGLMHRYACGDEQAFQELFSLLYARVYRFHLRSTREPEVAEDLTQKTFLKLHVARRRYREGAKVRPWVFAIAKNLQRDLFRKRSRSGELLSDRGDAHEAADPRSATDKRDILLRKRLEEAIAQLPEGQRDVVLLHKFEGLSMAEVAETLGIGVSAAKVRAHRAYGALKEILKNRV